MIRLVKGVRFLIKLQAHPAIQATVDQVFPVSYSDKARKLALYSQWNKLQTDVGAFLVDLSPKLRKLIVDYMIADAPSLRDLEHDDSICREWLKEAVHGHWHASGTCHMGKAGDPQAVTDYAGRVRGVQNLRVADASIMPSVPCANTNIPTIMIGEKIAATILVEQTAGRTLAAVN
jgi:5-(hydroxymethyl)furfural/furfural oxidase